jgi:hypothetical protein
MNVRSLDVPTLRAAWWARRALRLVHEDLREHGLRYRPVPAPPRLPRVARRGVLAILRRRSSTCLERALVLQRWDELQGQPRDIIVAVKGPTVDFAAHAWLEGDPDGDVTPYAELLRLPPR